MKWYYKVLGGHTHVRVFINGALAGRLIFRNEEFRDIKANAFFPSPLITMIEDGPFDEDFAT